MGKCRTLRGGVWSAASRVLPPGGGNDGGHYSSVVDLLAARVVIISAANQPCWLPRLSVTVSSLRYSSLEISIFRFVHVTALSLKAIIMNRRVVRYSN